MKVKKFRLAIITSHVIQYQGPLFKEIAKCPDIDLTVLFCSKKGAEMYTDIDMGVDLKWDLNLLDGYRYKFLTNHSPFRSGDGFLTYINFGLVKELKKGEFDAIIMMIGWAYVTAWLGFLASRRFKIPFFVYGDSSFIEGHSFFKKSVKKIILRKLFRQAFGFMTTGAMNSEFYKYYGADEHRFFFMPWAIDNDRFKRESLLSQHEKESLRRRCGIGLDKVIIVFSGKLIARKNPLHLIKALEMLNSRDMAEIVFMGDGEQRQYLENYVSSRNVYGVHFLGFVNQSEIPKIYGISDIFVLPSSFDPRGTVTNEAMACSLPVIVSDKVGVYGKGDIVRDGENGFVFRVGDIAELAKILDSLVGDRELRNKMGRRSLEIISEWNYRRDVDGILQALKAASLNHP